MNLAAFAALFVYAVTRGAQSGVEFHSGSVGSQVGDLLGFAALCGLLSYASVELIKRLTGLRGSVNRAVVESWLRAQQFTFLGDREFIALVENQFLEIAQRTESPFADAFEGERILRQWFSEDPLSLLLGALHTRDLADTFDLPPERLVAQISTAIDVALFQPATYGLLLAVVARLPPRPPATMSDADVELLGSHEAQHLRLSLDDLQTMLTQRWRRIVQGAVVWIAGAYGVLTTFAGGLSGTNQARYLLAALILGGPIAWAIRDLTAVVGRMRQ